MGKNINKV